MIISVHFSIYLDNSQYRMTIHCLDYSKSSLTGNDHNYKYIFTSLYNYLDNSQYRMTIHCLDYIVIHALIIPLLHYRTRVKDQWISSYTFFAFV